MDQNNFKCTCAYIVFFRVRRNMNHCLGMICSAISISFADLVKHDDKFDIWFVKFDHVK